MKVLLVRPKMPLPDPQLYPPFSLVTLAGHAESPTTVKIVDFQAGQTFKDADWRPDVVGFTAFTSQLSETDRLAQEASRLWPNTLLVAGGAGVTSNPDYASGLLPNLDLLVVGDGESFMSDLSNVFDLKQRIIRYPFFDLAQHKLPMWSMIDYNRYVKTVGLSVETSRGCPMNCVFCTAHLVSGKKWRARTAESVVEELQALKKLYRCRLFYFTDDNATVNPERWTRLMELIVEADLNVELRVPEGIQAHHLTEETLSLMKRAGFRMITIGAESGVQRVLDHVIDKGGLTVEQIEYVVNTASRVGLGINCYFVIGIPGETLEEASETVAFAEKLRKLGAYSCMVRNAIPIPGTRMYQQAKAKGYITVPEDKLNDLTFLHGNYHFLKTPEWNAADIIGLVAAAQKQDARHILKHRKGHMLKVGVKKLLTNPGVAIKRFRQLRSEAK
jgi:magnesium-protoporphyrin IX monomethyl ester (oxidative) cyclase